MAFLISRCYRLLAIGLLVTSTLFGQRTQHVVVVVVDGTRYTETFGDSTHANIPITWNQLRPLGTLYTAFWNDGVTMTNSGHASILSGTRQSLKNNGTELPHDPTVFEYLRKQTGAPADQCWVILGKTKLKMLAFSDHKEYGSQFSASVKYSASEYDNHIALQNTTAVLSSHHPKFMIVNVPAADEHAHNGHKADYIRAIQEADTVVSSIWKAIQSDSLLRDKTTMIVTNDHGRHTTDYTDHGDKCEGCRHITLLVLGPDTPAGVVDSSLHKQVDLAPTVGKLLGFETPYSVGGVIESVVAAREQIPSR
jgi:arylsulfatase A-like enzyme